MGIAFDVDEDTDAGKHRRGHRRAGPQRVRTQTAERMKIVARSITCLSATKALRTSELAIHVEHFDSNNHKVRGFTYRRMLNSPNSTMRSA
jgi:hypothetical protein